MKNVITGRKPVLEALKAGTQIEKIIILQGVHGAEIDTIRLTAQERHLPLSEVSKQQFRDLVPDATAQGVVAVVPERQYVDLDHIIKIAEGGGQNGFVLILDEIEDPQNLGALVRTAECAGVHGVIIPKHHSASVTAAVIKASAGATEHVAIAEVTNLVHTLKKLKEMDYWIIGLDGKANKLYTEVDYKTPIALVVGNEGKGIRRLVKEHCDFLVRIPLFGKIESLNASVAGGLVMFEVVKQRTPS
jgi:23S rRNA (guanosine2251-2'-O)-methyltransferase